MKASQLLAVGVIAFSVTLVAAGSPVSFACLRPQKESVSVRRAAASSLPNRHRELLRQELSIHEGVPVRGKKSESCSTDGVRVIEADSR